MARHTGTGGLRGKLMTGSNAVPPSTPAKVLPCKRTRVADRDGDGGGGGGVAAFPGGFDGQMPYFERVGGVGYYGTEDNLLNIRALFEPVGLLEGLLITNSTVSPTFLRSPRGLRGLQPTFQIDPIFFHRHGPVKLHSIGGLRNVRYTAEEVKAVLDAASPDLNRLWTVVECSDVLVTKGALHAKVLIARFAPGTVSHAFGGQPFLRVCVSSANCSHERGQALDAYWVQDFPIHPIDAPADLDFPIIPNDPQSFRQTLRCFLRELVRARFPDEKDRYAHLGPIARLLHGADFSGARVTLLASVPGVANDNPLYNKNGIHGLVDALTGYTWPEEAGHAPINYFTGALGNMSEQPWRRWFLRGATADGRHGVLPPLRVVWPDNATAFQGNEAVLRSLVHQWYYDRDGTQEAFPHDISWNAETKPGFWSPDVPALISRMKLLYRVAPAHLGLPADSLELRAWFLVGSCNIVKAAWGDGQKPPTNFELSVLFTTPDPQVAARWLDAIPMKLPGDASLTGLEQTVVVADPYRAPNHAAPYTRERRYAPFNYGRDTRRAFNEARAHVLGQQPNAQAAAGEAGAA